jgi:hypothetical protein
MVDVNFNIHRVSLKDKINRVNRVTLIRVALKSTLQGDPDDAYLFKDSFKILDVVTIFSTNKEDEGLQSLKKQGRQISWIRLV